jgi:hypothetical protein
MHVVIERPDPKRVVAHLREGSDEIEIIGWNAAWCTEQLLAALDDAAIDGYGECYWPEPTGQYWWMLKRAEDRLEVAVLWSRSSAVGWQCIFRATDGFVYARDLITEALTNADDTPSHP